MTEYIETEIRPGDTRDEILTTLAGIGNPFVFVVCRMDPQDGSLDLKAETGGGITDVGTVRALLEKTLEALP